MSLVSYVDTVSTTYYDLRVAQLNNRNDFSPCFLCRKLFPVFWYTLLTHAISHTKSVYEIEHISVFSYSHLYFLHEYKLCRCARITTLEAGDAATCNAALCGCFWRSNRNHYLLVQVMRALAASISTYVRTYRNSIIKCTRTVIPTAVPWRFVLK